MDSATGCQGQVPIQRSNKACKPRTTIPSPKALGAYDEQRAERNGLIKSSRWWFASSVNHERMLGIGKSLTTDARGGERSGYGERIVSRLLRQLIQNYRHALSRQNLIEMDAWGCEMAEHFRIPLIAGACVCLVTNA